MRRALIATALTLALSGNAAADDALRAIVAVEAHSTGVPVALANAVVTVESRWKPKARGSAGEWGLFQILCPTARAVGFDGNCTALLDPQTNARFGLRYLRACLDRADGDWKQAVSLYNRGLYAAPAVTSYSHLVMKAAGQPASNPSVPSTLSSFGFAARAGNAVVSRRAADDGF
jgi:soluble lytic murein transglycosylase-like protein